MRSDDEEDEVAEEAAKERKICEKPGDDAQHQLEKAPEDQKQQANRLGMSANGSAPEGRDSHAGDEFEANKEQ